jgi:hypothetical protein
MSSSGYIKSGIEANLLVQATGTAILKNATYSIISTCTATNNAVTLPAYPIVGSEYTIRNNGVAYAQIFPPSGGIINNFAADSSLPLASGGGIVKLVASGGNTYTVMNQNSVPLLIPIAAAHTCTINENGATYLVNGTNAYTITLPQSAAVPGVPTQNGLRYKFILTDTGNIVAIGLIAAANIAGTVLKGPVGGPLMLTAANSSLINFANVAGNPGAIIEVVSSATAVAGGVPGWTAIGTSSVALGITLSA